MCLLMVRLKAQLLFGGDKREYRKLANVGNRAKRGVNRHISIITHYCQKSILFCKNLTYKTFFSVDKFASEVV